MVTPETTSGWAAMAQADGVSGFGSRARQVGEKDTYVWAPCWESKWELKLGRLESEDRLITLGADLADGDRARKMQRCRSDENG
jgi:hypothetical protein